MEKQITAEEIHKDFYGAEERLYVEAIGLSQGGLVTKTSKAERLKKIGFGASKTIKQCEEQEKKRAVSGHMINVIEYFRIHYPQNKFITEAEVKKLCEKYGLLLGDAFAFTGDIPEKNLVEIEKFKLRKEDWKEKNVINWFMGFDSFDSSKQQVGRRGFFSSSRRSGQNMFNEDLLMAQYHALTRDMEMPRPTPRPVYSEPKKEFEQPAFKICAPKQDFNVIHGWEVQDGYRLVYDPIVLQPVSKDGIDGYLIVTAWGDEAADEIVQNPATN